MTAQNGKSSDYASGERSPASGYRFGIVVSDWNGQVTAKLEEGAVSALKINNVRDENIVIRHVPGSVELTYGAKLLAENLNPDAVICLGCVVQGETRHFDYVCDSITQGITQLNIRYNIPFIFGVLTTDNVEQAIERAGGKFGNKGEEAALAAIRMVHLRKETEKS